MSTDPMPPPAATDIPVVYNIQDSAIDKLTEDYMPLTINGLNDRKGLELVSTARKHIKALRVSVEKRRVELKAGALEYGRKVDAEAKRITGRLTNIETHLESEEAIIEREKLRISEADSARKKEILDRRIEQLKACEQMANPLTIAGMSDRAFELFLTESQTSFAKRKEEAAAAEAARLAEAEKIKAERAELEKLRAEQAAAQKRLDDTAAKMRSEAAQIEADRLAAERAESDRQEAERKRVAQAQADQIQAGIVERQRLAFAEKTRVEAEQLVAKQKADDEAEAAAEGAARVRAAALRPDREKLLSVAEVLKAMAIALPSVSAEAMTAKLAIIDVLQRAASEIQMIVETQVK